MYLSQGIVIHLATLRWNKKENAIAKFAFT